MRAATGRGVAAVARGRLSGGLGLRDLRLRLHGAVRSARFRARCGTARSPTGTVWSASTRISAIVPATGEGTSASTLSVEISTSGSSTATESPTFTRHSSTVPSATESPISGKVTSTSSPPGRARAASGAAAAGRAVSVVRLYLAEHGSHLNCLIGFREDLYKCSGGRGGNLRVDLVGRYLDERLVGLDPVAHLLQPPQHRALGDRLPHLGHGDLDARGAGCHPNAQL